ncbi:uncharacterized protein LOC122331436 [Puntigrus tetrazona]|uniref:uncharacterized protein LOC122331436 n=1 Tax=Puntigrus tetrazona TaxID=1606681 RepID=UPI001C893CE5|nr:uncharacterized protein LOC122331436 [Puntigrus tetrazona]
MSRKRVRKDTNVNSPDNITGDDSTSTKNDTPAPTYTHEKEKGDLRDETIAILKTDKQFLQEELVKKDSFIRELIKKNQKKPGSLKASKKSPRIAISSSEEVIDSDESSSLSDSSLKRSRVTGSVTIYNNISLYSVRNTRGIIRRYLDTLEAFKKVKSMKAAFDAIGVDRNTIARTAIIAELHLAAPDVLKTMGQWNDKTETLSRFIGKCHSALTTEIKEKITQMKADGDLLPIA